MSESFKNLLLNADDDDDDSDDGDYVPSEHSSLSDPVELSDNDDEDSDGDDSSTKGGCKRKADDDFESEKKKTEATDKRNSLIWENFKAVVGDHRKKIQQRSDSGTTSGTEPERKTTEKKLPSPSENVIQPTTSQNGANDEQIEAKSTPTSLTSAAKSGCFAAKTTPLAKQTTVSKFGASPSSSAPTSSRLNSILSQIGQQKKSKNMLEQSREHWDDFKKKEGISDELALHNRGAKGFLDRQDFLARVDSRQADQLRQLRLQLMNKRRTT